MHRHFFKILSKNPEYVQKNCNDGNISFQFAYRKWYFYNNPQCRYKKQYNHTYSNTNKIINILILVQIILISPKWFEIQGSKFHGKLIF